jgi:serine/threonine-protein kinase
VATALAHVTQATPELPDSVPPTLRDAIMAALAKDPADRPESAAELAAMLGMPSGRHNPERGLDAVADAAGATMLVPAPVADPGAPAAQRSRLRRWWLLPVAALAVTVVGILAAASFSSGSGSPTTHSTNTSTSTTSTTNAAAANAGANVGGAATTTPTTPTTSTTTPAAARTTAPAPAPPAPVHGGRKGKKK